VSLRPNDPTYDNGPAILSRILSDGVCKLGPHSYHVNHCAIPEGVVATLEGVSSGYRNVHAGITRICPTEDWDGTLPLIEIGVETPNRATARGVIVRDIHFTRIVDAPNVAPLGTALKIHAADVWIVERCEFWKFDEGIGVGQPGHPLVNLSIRDSHFVMCNRGIRSPSGISTFALLSIVNNHFLQCGTGDPASPGGCVILRGGATQCIEKNRFENNFGRGVLWHDAKGSCRDNYFEDNVGGNLVVTGASTKLHLGYNSFDAAGFHISSPAKVYKQCVCEEEP
jgi:hypothetical protein